MSKGRECVKTNIDVFFTYFAHTFSRNPGSISPCFPRQTPTSALSLAPLAQDRPADMRLLPHTKRARVATHRPHRCSSLGSTLRTHSTIQRSQTHAPALLASLQSPIITVRRRRAASVASNELEAGRMVEQSTSQNWGQNRPPKATTLAHQNFPAPQHTLRLLSHTIPTPSCSGLPIPLARLALCGHLARRPGRRPYRHAPAQGDRAAPLRPPHTQALRRRAEGGAADAPLLGRRRPTSTTGTACGNAVAGRGYFGVPVPAQPPNGLFER